ncbi:acid protease [Cristinia sonorae]|uniref:Acid protease n=1 Tax=Cristinia sonorae TaxID=1940300 RepID=A0A8K0UGE9_9AGAR|nr:acid protease [Cristinia sonorae]
MFNKSFLVILLLATGALSSPLIKRTGKSITLPVARRVNITGGAHSLLKHDQARAKAIKERKANIPTHGKAKSFSAAFGVPITNQVVDYAVTVGVGNPPTAFNLLIDTGSSNTWVGAQPTNPFVISSSSQDTGNLVEVIYGSGFVLGEQFIDQLTIGDVVIENQSLGAAILNQGFTDVDGIIGIGPTVLTTGTLFPATDDLVPTVTDNAFAQGLIDADLVSVSFAPTQDLSSTNGELIFGDVDPAKFVGDIHFVPITSTVPANEFVGIDQTITYGAAATPILNLTSGITDTGTTLLLIASDAFAAYQTVTGGVPDDDTGLLRLTPEQFGNLESLFFNIGDATFEFTPNAQIFPRALNTAIGGSDDFVYLIVNDIGSLSGEGLDFIDGMTFQERFFTVFDSTNSQFGIANTVNTFATPN